MIEKISMPSSIRLKYLTGVDTDGKEMFKTRTINNITSSVTDELVYGLKAMLEEVQNSPIAEFTRIETSKITQS
ncbi:MULTISPECIES: DUF1659 domain-containing protein [Acetoanaerobium]|jgi:hypothetical protein|uniref:DUF1659 domain-containing protein n=1 Tax=Acetoanaerobium sticklandii (strain ATCC 12662 / DSM 519 / JCM 1433 / CCUG 9281 / NCIMB 10654 / HF) TaxID=499177 RepID=E3PVM2_ACESD|nr:MULTISPECIES: DUF1659 domain-containing protein [Acetoanaerobium]CBH20589.1 conserved protein of unknown function [Acetoanaerobium sticklandii]